MGVVGKIAETVLPLATAALGATGVGLPAAVGIGVPMLVAAMQVAQGIAQKNPAKIAGGVLTGVSGGLGSLPGGILQAVSHGAKGASKAAQVASAASTAGQGISTATKAASAAGAVKQAADFASAAGKNTGQIIGGAGQGVATAAKAAGGSSGSSNTLQDVLTGLQGAGAATQGVMGVLNAFKKPQQAMRHGMGFSSLGGNLASAGGAQISNFGRLPEIGAVGPGQVPSADFIDPRANPLLLQLLGAFRA